ncbi:MAG: hypothetical protein CM15mP40_09650 [Alphaproteobacteria bacterium]|nr:MAG: hypothetical protein CM15mP40_09650 [Alphaproteobacteria bacterium]
MAINLNLKIILKALIITFLIVKDSLASTISGYEIKSLIEKWLEKQGVEANVNILESLKYPACEPDNIIINDISGNSKLIKVNCIGNNPWQFIVRNKVNKQKSKTKNKQLSNFYALKNFKEKGSIIKEKDLIVIKRKNSQRNLFISDKTDIVGKKLKKSVNSNQLLKRSNLEKDWLIKKNSQVIIINNKSFVTIKEDGLAMNDANYMDMIKVKNIKSGKVIVGYAKNEKKVILNTKQY